MNRPYSSSSSNPHPQQAMQMPESSRRSSLEIARDASSPTTETNSHSTASSTMHSLSSRPLRSILSTSNSSSNSSSSSASVRRRRERADGVSFSTRASVWIIPSVNDMSEAQIDELWTTDDDTATCQRDVVRTIKTLRRILEQHPEDDDNDGSTAAIDERHSICTRGLEHMRSAMHLEQMRINKDCHYDAIFDEQERQESLDIYDFDEMSLVSRHGSAWARERALERARGDEEFVQSVKEEMRASEEWEELTTQDQDTYGLDSIEQELANSLRLNNSQDQGTMSSSTRSSPNHHHHQRRRASEQLHLRRSDLRKSFSERPDNALAAKQRRSLADADYHVLNKSAPRRLSDATTGGVAVTSAICSSNVTVP